MAKSRKLKMTDAVYRPHRNGERLPAQELVDRATEELTRLARIPQENPDPVLRVSAEYVLLYCNPAGEELCRVWDCRLGQKVPTAVHAIVSAALADGAVARHELSFGSRTYWLTAAPSVADGYVNLYARDITDHNRIEEALRQAERKLRAIFDNTSDGILLLDLETRKFTTCNPSGLQMLGYTQDEFVTLGIQDLHFPEDLPFIYAQIEEFLTGGKPVRHDIRFKRKDGSVLFADLSPDLVLLDGKRYIVVALKDITERKRMEEELRRHAEQLEELVAARTGELQESERRYRSLAENDPDIIQRFDRGLRRLYVNPAFALATGVSPAVALGQTERERGLPEDLLLLWEQAAQTVFRTGESQIIEFEMPTPRGARHYEAHLVPEFAPDGTVEHLLTITRDITERQRAEETLRQLSRKDEGALQVARMGHWEFDVATGLFTFNDQYYTLHGTTAREAGGYQMTTADFARRYVHPDDAHLVQESIQEATAADDPNFQLQTEARILRTDGEVRWVTVWFRAEKDAQGRTTRLYGVNQDITERKRAEEALRVSEEHYRSLFDNMLNGFAFCRMFFEHGRPVDFTYLEVNRAFETLTGLKDVTGKKVSEVIPGLRTTNPELFETYGRVALTGRPEQLETYVEPLGIWFLISVYSPRKEHFVAVFDVITERKRAEEALRESEERYRILLEHGFDGIFVHEDFRIVQLNDRLAEMVGCTRSELLGGRLIDMFTPDSQERIRQYARSGASGYFELELRRPDGRLVEVESFGAPCRFHGREARIVGLRDITERKRAEEALRHSERRYRKLFEANLAGVYLTRTDGTILDFNDAMMRMLGYDAREEVFEHRASDFYVDPEFRKELMRWLQKDGVVPALEAVLQRKDGSVLHALGSAVLLVNEQTGEPYIQGAAIDITELKRAEESLRELNATLEAKVAQRTEDLRYTVDRLRHLTLELSQAEDRERKRIADILHEDVQQTLAAAKFHLSLLDEPRPVEEAAEIVGQVKHMLKEAIEKSRHLSHELSPALYQVELIEILNWLARHMQEKHGLTVRVEAHGPVDSPSEPLKAFLYKVAQELLFNVVKHAGVREARLRVRRMGQSLYLSVIDQGWGFDPQKLERAAGFGLLGIRERVQSLGGRMKIKSAPGAGSRFLIAVPYELPS